MIYSHETERQCLAGALRHPEILSEVAFFVKEEDFSPGANKTIYSAILDALKKEEKISSFTVAEKLNNAGIVLSDLDIKPQDYLDDIRLIPINEAGTLGAFKDLKRVSVRNELFCLGESLKGAMLKNGNSSIDEIIDQADRLYSDKLSVFESATGEVFEDIFENLQDTVEERGNNPIQDFGIKGPFSRVNEIYGSLLRRGNINVVAARQGQGKTQLGQYYMMHVLWKYNVPVLHLDMGEMSKFELQMRATSLLTGGKVSPDMLETGNWRKNPETEQLVRAAWPTVKKLVDKYFYKDVSELTPDQIISALKRFYLSKVKHRKCAVEDGTEFVAFYDYLKAFENNNSGQSKFLQEYQLMGYFMQKVKRALQKNVPGALWTSLQVNRIGITGNKPSDAIDDTENVFGLSDRIIQQATHAWLLRRMTTDELALEPNMGNYKFINRKARHLGNDRDAHLLPVRMPDGSYKDNYVYLEGRNFVWKEIGDLATLKDKIAVAPLDDEGKKENVDL